MFVFVGPTLSVEEGLVELDAVYLPPAAQGDVYRACKERPFAIGIIDGYFERVPAVWHKEILWALTQGIHVFGAASMGALRAAELHAFGMRGVGAVFDGFASGVLDDDDEVAVAHGDARSGYVKASEAMVNIRATLEHAERRGRIGSSLRQLLERLAKQTFYAERSYPRLLALAAQQGVSETDLATLQQAFTSERQDQKRRDALAMLRAVRECRERREVPGRATFAFAHTETWSQVIDWAETQPPLAGRAEAIPTEAIPVEAIAAELRCSGAAGRARAARVWSRVFAGALRRLSGRAPASDASRAADSLSRQDPFERWLTDNELDGDAYQALLGREAELRMARANLAFDFDSHLLDELRVSGGYRELRDRAHDKHKVLCARGLAAPRLDDAGMDAAQLRRWYFEERLAQPLPEDLRQPCLELGLADPTALDDEALRELLYCRLKPPMV